MLIGCGKVDLLSVLTSHHLQYEGSVQMKVYNKQDKDGRSSQSSLSPESPLLGELEVGGKKYLSSQSGEACFPETAKWLL